MAASSVSGNIFHELYYLYMAIALVVGGLVLGWLGYILVKYRAKPGMAKPRDAPKAGVLPAERGHPIWSYIMALVIAGIMFGLAFGTISATHDLETPPETGDRLDVNVVGSTFTWTLEVRDASGLVVRTPADWTLPVDTAIVANVTSVDVWHNFALTELRLRIDAVPGQTNHLWWKVDEPSKIRPVCVQLCGTGHADMKGTLTFVTKDDYRAYWAGKVDGAFASLDKAGQVLNMTYDGASLIVTHDTHNATKAFAVRVTNAGSSTQAFASPTSRIEVAPGASGFLWFPANAAVNVKAVS